MQTQGTLAQTSLAALLEAMQAERATGTLSLRHGEESRALYFLFGHLFHAAGDQVQGEEAVIGALGWPDGNFTFDPRAKLPAEETIKSPTSDLLAEAQRRAATAPVDGAPRQAPYDAPGLAHEGFDAAPAGPGDAGMGVTEPYAAEAAAVADAQRWGVEQPGNGETKVTDFTSMTAPGAPPGAPASQPMPPYTTPMPSYPPLPPPSTAPSLPAAPAAPAPSLSVLGNPDAEPLSELYPLPSGKAIYEGLKSAFVDFPKLLRTLETDKHTGYVRLDGADFSGVLLLHDGHVLEALFSDGRMIQGVGAFVSLRRRMEAGQGLLDVIELNGETVVALAQLLTARPMFTGLLGRFINFDSLLEYLGEEKVDGSVVVAGGTETGVILLRKGAVHGAYTSTQRDLDANTSTVTALAAERPARIEVKAGAEPPAGIDVEAALRTG